MSAVTGFLTPLCNCRTLVLGVGVKIRSSVPFDSAAHASAHFLSICSLCTALIAALKGGIKTLGAVLLVCSSTVWLFQCFISLQPVDSFAALSAFLFPFKLEWTGTQ